MILSSGAQYSVEQMDAVFDHLEKDNPFQGVDEFLTKLAKNPQVTNFKCK